MSRKTDRQNQRLLNVARALRESPAPKEFTMEHWFHEVPDCTIKEGSCGTPACALGHLALRKDLQTSFGYGYDGYGWGFGANLTFRGEKVQFDDVRYSEGGHPVLEYFGIDGFDFEALFGTEGCGRAKTTKAAAQFIERFVARRSKK